LLSYTYTVARGSAEQNAATTVAMAASSLKQGIKTAMRDSPTAGNGERSCTSNAFNSSAPPPLRHPSSRVVRQRASNRDELLQSHALQSRNCPRQRLCRQRTGPAIKRWDRLTRA